MWRKPLIKVINAANRIVFYNAGISYRAPQVRHWQNYLAYDD